MIVSDWFGYFKAAAYWRRRGKAVKKKKGKMSVF
jgi:hypothetical protein